MRFEVRRFTLIEMLVVIGVMAMLLTIATPAFNRIAKGNAISRSTRELGGKINASRTYAIEKKCYLALVFPDADECKAADLPETFYNASYRPCIVYKDGDDFKFSAWVNDEGWSNLETGVVIYDGKENFGFCAQNATEGEEEASKAKVQNVDLSYGDKTGTGTVKRAIVFQKDGKMYSPENKYMMIRLSEGVYDTDKFVSTHVLEGGKTVFSLLKVNPFSCRVKYGDVLGDKY